jgi:hypothetical protein
MYGAGTSSSLNSGLESKQEVMCCMRIALVSQGAVISLDSSISIAVWARHLRPL